MDEKAHIDQNGLLHYGKLNPGDKHWGKRSKINLRKKLEARK